MVEGVLVTDASGRVVLVNRALVSMLSLSMEVLGRGLLEFSRNPEIHETVTHVLKEKKTRQKEISVFVAGEEKSIVMSSSPLTSGTVSVFYNVTEIRRLEDLRKDFVANVSHELKTPLTCIRGYAETLKAGALQDAVAAERFLDKIEKNATQLQALVEDLLSISEIESGGFSQTPSDVPLLKVVKEVLEDFSTQAASRNVVLSVPPNLKVSVPPESLRRILVNLVDNALKYSPQGSLLEIGAESAEGFCRIWVRDDGIGLSPDDAARVFERFYRADKARTRSAASGTGLGLSIVKHLVQAQGGDVGVDSEPGKGATFWFKLPLSKESS